MVKRVIGGNYGLQLPFMKKLIVSNAIEAYNLPQGVICQLYRAMAAKQPGVVSHVGLQTYMDPRQEGGEMNAATTEDSSRWSRWRDVNGCSTGRRRRRWRSSAGPPRTKTATYRARARSDDAGRYLSIAQAVHNAGGTVVCQVERLAQRGASIRRWCSIPGFLIDLLVLVPEQMQTYAARYDPSRSGETRCRSPPSRPIR